MENKPDWQNGRRLRRGIMDNYWNWKGVTLGKRVDDLPNPWGEHFRHLFDGDARLERSVGE